MVLKTLRSAIVLLGLSCLPVTAQGMPPEQIKSILELTKANWIVFRDWQGSELIYFTHLESWKCGIDKVLFGLNDGPVNVIWELEACNPKQPNAVTKEKPYLTMPANSVQQIRIQLIYADGTKSSIETFTYDPATAH